MRHDPHLPRPTTEEQYHQAYTRLVDAVAAARALQEKLAAIEWTGLDVRDLDRLITNLQWRRNTLTAGHLRARRERSVLEVMYGNVQPVTPPHMERHPDDKEQM